MSELSKREDIIYAEATSQWGKEAQLLQVVEECSELIKAIIKNLNRGGPLSDVLDEVADVEIMCAQIRHIFKDDSYRIDEQKKYKLRRLAKKLGIDAFASDDCLVFENGKMSNIIEAGFPGQVTWANLAQASDEIDRWTFSWWENDRNLAVEIITKRPTSQAGKLYVYALSIEGLRGDLSGAPTLYNGVKEFKNHIKLKGVKINDAV